MGKSIIVPALLAVTAICFSEANAKTIELPGEVSDISIGASGRYIVAVHEKLKKATVFDTQERKIAGFINLSAGDALIACGRGGVAVFYPSNHVYQLWSYDPPEKKVSKKLPFKGMVRAVAMGPDSPRHVFVERNMPVDDPRRARRILNVFDLVSGRLLLPPESEIQVDNLNHSRTKSFLLTSMPGNLVTRCRPDGYGRLMTWDGAELKMLPTSVGSSRSDGWLSPGPTGDIVYSATHGIMSDSLRLLTPSTPKELDLPSLTHRIHLKVKINRFSDGTKNKIEDPGASNPKVFVGGVDGVGLELPKLIGFKPEELSDDVRYESTIVPLAKRFYLIPKYDVFIYLPSSFNKFEMIEFSVEEKLKNLGEDYLLVNSPPPSIGKIGTLFSHQVTAASSSGGIKFKLQSGPEGLAVNDTGLVRWNVPTNMRGQKESIILSLSDSEGRERFYTFTIQIAR
ncbi:MAG: hypothetical protein ACI8XO_002323 [Verrucomicrobiales bacterium]|jgi:hypothetical protein